MDKPDVDSIEGLSPAIAIEQKSGSHNPRSTVGTVTEIYDYLRLLYARAGHARAVRATASTWPRRPSVRWSTRCCRRPAASWPCCSPRWSTTRRGEHAQLLDELAGQGFRARAHRRSGLRDRRGAQAGFEDASTRIEAVVDRFRVRARGEPAPGRVVRDRDAPLGNGHCRGRLPGQSGARARCCSRAGTPVRYAASRCRRSSRACSPSTIRPAPVRPATVWASRSSSIPSASSCIRICRSPAARCAAGTVAMRTTSSCCSRSRATTTSTSRRPGASCPSARAARCCSTAAARSRSSSAIARAVAAAHASAITFEGIVPNLERRYRETDSQAVREELRKYLGTRACIDCAARGSTRPRARCWSTAAICPQVTRLTVGQAREYFAALHAPGLARRGRRAHRARGQRAAALPGRCRPGLSESRSRRRHALGRRGAAHPPGKPGGLRTHRRHVHPR